MATTKKKTTTKPKPKPKPVLKPEPVKEVVYVEKAGKEKHILPALLSFFIPGLGQIIKGEFIRGLGIMVIGGIVAATILIMIGLILYPLFWIWNIYDAYTKTV